MNRNLLFVAFALLLWGFGEGVFFNFVPIYLDNQFHLSKSAIGLVLGAFGLSMAITHIPAGRLSDRFGRRPLLVAAWLFGLSATVVMWQAASLHLYLVGLFAYGLTAFVSSPLNSYVTAARGRLSVGLVLSLTTATFSLGMVLGPVTGGWIGDNYGMRTSFLISAVVFAVSTLFILLIERQPIDHEDPAAPASSLWDNKHLVGFMGVLAFAIFSMYLSQPLTPNFLEGVRRLSLSESGIIFTAGALGNSLLAIALSRTDPRRGFLVAQALCIVFAALIWKGTSLPLFALGYFVLGGFRAGRPLALAQAREMVHDSQMGLTYGIMETIGSAIFILTPPLAGLIFEYDPALVYPLSICLIGVSIIVSYLYSVKR